MTKEQIIRKHSSPSLLQEVESLFDEAITGEWESITDFTEAFAWIDEKADTTDEWSYLRTPCRKVGIALGYYVPMTPEEVASSMTTARFPWDFKLGGVPYQWVTQEKN